MTYRNLSIETAPQSIHFLSSVLKPVTAEGKYLPALTRPIIARKSSNYNLLNARWSRLKTWRPSDRVEGGVRGRGLRRMAQKLRGKEEQEQEGRLLIENYRKAQLQENYFYSLAGWPVGRPVGRSSQPPKNFSSTRRFFLPFPASLDSSRRPLRPQGSSIRACRNYVT